MKKLIRSVTDKLSSKCPAVMENIKQKLTGYGKQPTSEPHQETIIQAAMKNYPGTILHVKASSQFIENVFQLKRRWVLYVQRTYQSPVSQPSISVNEIGGDGEMVFFLVEGGVDDFRFSTREYIKTPLPQSDLGLKNEVFKAYHKMLVCKNQDHNDLEYLSCKIDVVKALLEYESELFQ